MGHLVRPCESRLTPTAFDARERAAGTALGGHFWWPFEHGNHGYAFSSVRLAGMYASWH